MAERFRRIGEADRYAPRLRHRAVLGAGIALVALASVLPRAPLADGVEQLASAGEAGGSGEATARDFRLAGASRIDNDGNRILGDDDPNRYRLGRLDPGVGGPIQGRVEGAVHGRVDGGVRGGVAGTVRGGVEGGVQGRVQGEVQGGVQGRVEGGIRDSLAGGVAGAVQGGVEDGVRGGVEGGVRGGVEGGVRGGVEGGVRGGVEGGVRGGVEGDVRERLSAEDTDRLFALPEGGDPGDGGGDGAAPRRLKTSESIDPPELVSKIDPRYPDDARAARVEGQVLLQVTVDENGAARDVSVLRGIEGWPSMEQEAVRAVKQWRYRPASDHGRPVATSLMIFIQFSMDDGGLGRALSRLNAAETKITLYMHDVSLFDLLLELGRQASIPWIVCDGPRCKDLRVNADWNQWTVRAALLDLAARYRLRYDVDPDGVDVTLVPPAPSSPRAPEAEIH